MKTVTVDVSFTIKIEMPDDYDPVDVMCELDYDFYAPDECDVLFTDMTNWDILNRETE